VSFDLYPSLTGAKAAWQQMEVVSGNLANVSTTGFKEHRIRFEVVDIDGQEHSDQFVKTGMAGAKMDDGPIQNDGVETHLALRGRGFFAAETERGETILVRSGALQIDAEGFLTAESGERILGNGSPVYIPIEARISVRPDGQIFDQNGEEIGQLDLLDADEIEPMGATRWRPISDPYPAEDVTIIQGALEGSNTDALGGMTELIEASRYFEAYQKAMQTSDRMDGDMYSTVRG